jgi:uncharacterized protein (UPF0332 family)
MLKYNNIDENYNFCLKEVYFIILEEKNIEKINSLIKNAETCISSARIISKSIKKKAREWINVFTLNYETLHMLSEALLNSINIKSKNHKCLFACICKKFPDLKYDFDYLEKIRKKRNSINYYGKEISYKEWKNYELGISLIMKNIKKKLRN